MDYRYLNNDNEARIALNSAMGATGSEVLGVMLP